MNYSPKINKKSNIFNNCLQRDLSILGRVLLSKAEGLSHFVYPSLSLCVNPSTCKGINKIFLDFIWKNKSHKLKKSAEGGLEVLGFVDINNTFKINWLKKCLINADSIWYFISNNMFNKLGSLQVLLKCNYIPERLPAKLAYCKLCLMC